MGAEYSEKMADLEVAIHGEGDSEEAYFVMLEFAS